MKNKAASIVTCVVCCVLFGCASEQRRFTGFLHDYSTLKPHPTMQGALVYWNPDSDPTKYGGILVEPVEIHFSNHNDKDRGRPEDVAAFRRFVNDELIAAIGTHATIVTEPGPNVLRCRLQVANLQLTNSINEPPRPWPPRDYVLGTADIEAEARDSLSGELVMAYVSPQGTVERYTTFFLTGPPDRWEAAKTAVRNRIATIGDLYSHQVTNRSGRDVAH